MSADETPRWPAGDREGEWPEQLAVRVAWSYYQLGLTQQEVATRLGLNRVRVNRLLAEARRRGVVRIFIDSKLAENVKAEHRLAERYGLGFAEVVPTMTDDETMLAEVLGRAACHSVGRRFRSGTTIGVGWGVTLKAFAEAMPLTPLQDVAVVAMLGSLTRRSSIDIFEATTTLAGKLDAECFYMPGPIFCDTADSRDTLIRQPMLREVYNRALAVDMAVLSVGGVHSGTIRRMGVVSDADAAQAERAGAVGNFLGYYIDDAARIIDQPVNQRVIGIDPKELLAMPERIMISGGASKVAAMRAILRAGLLTGLVTDEVSAEALLTG